MRIKYCFFIKNSVNLISTTYGKGGVILSFLIIVLVLAIVISLLLGSITLILSLLRKKKNKVTKRYFLTAIVAFIILIGVSIASSPDDNNSTNEKTEVKQEKSIEKTSDENIKQEKKNEVTSVDWKKEINNIVKTDKTPTEKFDAVEEFVSTYPASEKEVEGFADDIIKKYQSGNYLDISEKEYLTQIFKSSVVEKNSSEDMKEFAFDYWQVQKYVYRGAEKPDSQFVESNEYQMNKSLQSIK